VSRREDDWFRLWKRPASEAGQPIQRTSNIVHMTCLSCTPPHNYAVNADDPDKTSARCPRCNH